MLLDFILYLILSSFHVSPQLYQCLVFLFWLIVKGRKVCFFDIVVVLLLISFFLSFSVEIFPQHLFSSIWVEKVEILRGVFSNEQGLSRILFDSRAAKLFACKSILRPANNFYSNCRSKCCYNQQMDNTFAGSGKLPCLQNSIKK